MFEGDGKNLIKANSIQSVFYGPNQCWTGKECLNAIALAFKNPFIIIHYFNMKFFRVGSYLVSINKTNSDQLFTINTQI